MSPFGKKKSKIIYAEKRGKAAYHEFGGHVNVNMGAIGDVVREMKDKCIAQDAEGSLRSLSEATGAPPGTVQFTIQMMSGAEGFGVKYRQGDNDILIRFFRTR